MGKVKVIVELDEKDYELAKADKIPSMGLVCRHVLVAVRDGELYDGSIGDCISREALKEQINATDFDFGDYYDNTEEIRERVCDVIDIAPTVPQVTVFTESTDEKATEDMKTELQSVLDNERPQGVWECHSDGYTVCYTCSKCNGFGNIQDKFCKHCGADMRKAEGDVK